MARALRLSFEDAFYYITARVVKKEKICVPVRIIIIIYLSKSHSPTYPKVCIIQTHRMSNSLKQSRGQDITTLFS